MSCCLDISDVELTYGRRTGYDVIFNFGDGSDPLTTFVPREGDYYTVEDDIATLVKVGGHSGISDDSGGPVSDDSGGPISDDSGGGGIVFLRDADGNQLFDSDGNPLYVT